MQLRNIPYLLTPFINKNILPLRLEWIHILHGPELQGLAPVFDPAEVRGPYIR